MAVSPHQKARIKTCTSRSPSTWAVLTRRLCSRRCKTSASTPKRISSQLRKEAPKRGTTPTRIPTCSLPAVALMKTQRIPRGVSGKSHQSRARLRLKRWSSNSHLFTMITTLSLRCRVQLRGHLRRLTARRRLQRRRWRKVKNWWFPLSKRTTLKTCLSDDRRNKTARTTRAPRRLSAAGTSTSWSVRRRLPVAPSQSGSLHISFHPRSLKRPLQLCECQILRISLRRKALTKQSRRFSGQRAASNTARTACIWAF